MKLADLLEQWTSDTIKNYVSLLGGKSSITRKAERINYICRQMLDEARLRQLWADLDPVAQRAVSNAYHNDGIFDATAFVNQYGELPPRPEDERNRHFYGFTPYRQPILFDLFAIDGQIPADLYPLLADLVLPVDRFQIQGIETLPRAVHSKWYGELEVVQAGTEMVGRIDLLTYLQLVDQGELRWSKSNKQLTAASVRKVMARLLDGDFYPEPEKVAGRYVVRPFGLDIFTQEGGLVTRTGKLTAAGRNYLQTQEPERLLEAFEKWAERGRFDELTRIAQLRGLNARGTRLTPAAGRRMKVIEALSWCPVNTWIAISDFYRAITIWQFDFEVEQTDWSNLYAGPYKDYGQLYGTDYWYIVKGLFINAILMEYLGTIGAVDLAYIVEDISLIPTEMNYVDESYSLHDGLIFFRINNWGAYLLGQADEYEPAQPRRQVLFTIDDELRLSVLAELLPHEQLLLEWMAEPIGKQVYRLDRMRILTAIENGQEMDHLSDFLEKNHRGPLPPPVSDWLSQLRKNQQAFREKGTAVIIELQHKDLQEMVVQDETLSRLCRVIDDKSILIMSGSLSRFRNRLKELGYLLSTQ